VTMIHGENGDDRDKKRDEKSSDDSRMHVLESVSNPWETEKRSPIYNNFRACAICKYIQQHAHG
jgi:hypothetical protein